MDKNDKKASNKMNDFDKIIDLLDKNLITEDESKLLDEMINKDPEAKK